MFVRKAHAHPGLQGEQEAQQDCGADKDCRVHEDRLELWGFSRQEFQ